MALLENLKEAALFAQKVGQLELYKQLLQAEDEVRDLTREKRRLEDKVEELERKARLKAAMIFKSPVYYQAGDATPFCPLCYEKDGLTLHLSQAPNYVGMWFCRVCNAGFPRKPEDDGPAFAIAR